MIPHMKNKVDFHWDEAKKYFIRKKKSKWPPKKRVIFQLRQFSIFLVKISWIGHWVSRIDWCKEHWFGSTFIVVRLSNIRSKTAKKCLFWDFSPFLRYVRQPEGHIGWVTLMPFASVNPISPRTNPWNFGGNCSAFGDVEKLSFNYVLERMGLNFY